MLNHHELARYTRQMMMPGWGESAQEALKRSIVFVAGAGGLGSPISIYLTVAGVGHLRLCDFDTVDASNLNRQILHNHTRLGLPKARSAQTMLEQVNPNVTVTPLSEKITSNNVDALVGNAAVIVDGMDNFETRLVLNACAARKKIPFVHGSVRGMEGRLTFIQVPETPCLQCVFPDGPRAEVFPVVGTTSGVIGTLQASEVLKYLTGVGETMKGKLLAWEGNKNTFRTIAIAKDPLCPVCGTSPR